MRRVAVLEYPPAKTLRYFRKVTPEVELAQLNLGSRPSRRNKQVGTGPARARHWPGTGPVGHVREAPAATAGAQSGLSRRV